jgi:hypothetical protein
MPTNDVSELLTDIPLAVVPARDSLTGDGITIEREFVGGGTVYNIVSPLTLFARQQTVSGLLVRLGGRGRRTTSGTLEFRHGLLVFLRETGPVRCFFCEHDAIGIHQYFLPYCAGHPDIPYMCGECSNWIYSDDFDADADMCMECLRERTFSCDSCGESTINYENVDGQTYCQDCYADLSLCPNCGHILDEDSDTCSRCPRSRRQAVPIHEAHAKVVDVLGKSRYGEEAKDRVYFGIELELEVSNSTQDDDVFQEACEGILEALGRDFIILKTDGSLGEGGVEINTLPCTLKVQKEKWENFFARKPSGLTSWKNNRCGIHIHITRAPLGMLTIGKMTVFLNDPANKEFIKQIAGRYDTSYAKMKVKKITDTAGEDRYEMLNLTSSRTIEMRIFKGTLNKRHFLADVEFAHALVHFCKTTSIRYLDTPKFMQFLRINRKDYPNLYAFSCKEEKGEDV